MSKRFIIATNGCSVENRDKITKFFDSKTWGYWHWFSELWILVGVPDPYNAQVLWVELTNATGLEAEENLLVLEVPHGLATYWGRAPKESWEWMASKLNQNP